MLLLKNKTFQPSPIALNRVPMRAVAFGVD
jgi:hypothetical protein